MKSVMKSVSPRICEKVASGDCTILVSKTAPKCKEPFKGYIYATEAKKWFHSGIIVTSDELLWLSNGKIKMCDGLELWADGEDYQCVNGKVIGEFICDKVDEYDFHYGLVRYNSMGLPSGFYSSYLIFSDDYASMCLSYDEVKNYGNGKTLYGLHISNLKIYDEPKQISDFLKPCPDPYRYCRACEYGIVRIPADEEEYALCHGGHYDYCEEHCRNILRKPPKGWQYVEEL